ncbi:MAG TPA: hypothetical protein PKC59_14710 [Burkholderiaceae bacterium]|nr:hypothetical protein [Burkholderiaceae bacterium]HNB43250.1 hypothetical protein [Burkholderiaceae bacterium]
MAQFVGQALCWGALAADSQGAASVVARAGSFRAPEGTCIGSAQGL